MIALFVITIIVLTFLFGSTAGWVVHWILHQNWFPSLAKGHDAHHQLYTPGDFESAAYRDAGSNSSSFVFVPILTLSVLLFFLPIAYLTGAWWIYFFVVAEGAIVGYINDKVHDAFHLQNHWLNKYSWFQRLKDLHLVHHIDPDYNHGIIWFGADKVLKTYRELQDVTKQNV